MCEEETQLSGTLLASVTEGPTCHYTININSPLLCKHPEFKTQALPSFSLYPDRITPQETTRVIVCERIGESHVQSTNIDEIENGYDSIDINHDDTIVKDEL